MYVCLSVSICVCALVCICVWKGGGGGAEGERDGCARQDVYASTQMMHFCMYANVCMHARMDVSLSACVCARACVNLRAAVPARSRRGESRDVGRAPPTGLYHLPRYRRRPARHRAVCCLALLRPASHGRACLRPAPGRPASSIQRPASSVQRPAAHSTCAFALNPTARTGGDLGTGHGRGRCGAAVVITTGTSGSRPIRIADRRDGRILHGHGASRPSKLDTLDTSGHGTRRTQKTGTLGTMGSWDTLGSRGSRGSRDTGHTEHHRTHRAPWTPTAHRAQAE
ncbi:hypothetical protein M433DRAFT_257358 [Acidomyces richmondensis BFW]|nr:hypothetical protein M433DRAFT_257358 [Acidomyces richmondensis BFW]